MYEILNPLKKKKFPSKFEQLATALQTIHRYAMVTTGTCTTQVIQ